MNRVVHFDISADKPERAKKFYEKTFDWKVDKWDGPADYWTVDTGKGEGINGGIIQRENPRMKVEDTIQVNSIDKYSEKIEKNGGKIIAPKTAIQDLGYMTHFQDTEGNVMGLLEANENVV